MLLFIGVMWLLLVMMVVGVREGMAMEIGISCWRREECAVEGAAAATPPSL